MKATEGLLAGFGRSELGQFLASAFKTYPQFILAFIASSGFISVFVYLMLFGLNAIDIISTSDIVFNAIVNLFLLLPVYAVIAVLAALWVALDQAIDGSGKVAGVFGGLFLAVRYGRSILLALAVAVFLIGGAGALLAFAILPPAQAEAMRVGGISLADLSNGRLLSFGWLDWIGASAGILLIWLVPLIYTRLTAGLLPRGLLTAIVVFTISNTLIGSAAHHLYAASARYGELGFMRRHATNLPQQIEDACPGERDIVWTGDKALVVLCRANSHKFVFYREYGAVVEKD